MEVLPHNMHEPAVPGSPALTNPDMILPYFSKLRASTSPIRKELSLLEPQSPPAHTYKELFDGFDGASQLHGGSRPQREGSADMNGIARPSLPGAWQTEEDLHAASNTWTDQNHAVERGGSPGLSTDNVTDKTLQGHESSQQFQDMAGRTMVAQKDVISTEPHQDTLAKDMDELNLKQNDDSLKALSDEDKNDPYYHAAEILANAKKRLTDMEGNLTRARRSLSVTGSTSKSVISNGVARTQSHQTKPYQGLESWKNRQNNTTAHTRVSSETSVPSPTSALFRTRLADSGQRGGLTAVELGGKAADLGDFNQANHPSVLLDQHSSTVNRSTSLGGRHPRLLDPLPEDDDAQSYRDSSPLAPEERLSRNMSEFDRIASPVRKPTRARSSLQLRDLHERMQELRGQLTSLKIRTQQDNLHRQSMQTLKQPSQFTVARDWSSSAAYVKNTTLDGDRSTEGTGLELPNYGRKNLSTPSAPTTFDEDGEIDGEHFIDSKDTNLSVPKDLSSLTPQSPEDESHFTPTHETMHEDIFQPEPGLSNFDASARDTDEHLGPTEGFVGKGELVVPTIEEKHEDRPDAFDYEHFFLHSGMGSFTRTSPTRRKSQSSASSAETTKPATPLINHPQLSPTTSPDSAPSSSRVEQSRFEQPRKAVGHSRQNSGDSISTVNTFATARESRSGRDTAQSDFDLFLPPARPHSQRFSARTSSGENRGKQDGAYLRASQRPHALRTQGSSSRLRDVTFPPADGSSIIMVLLKSAGELNGNASGNDRLRDDDAALVYRVLQSLQTACQDLAADGHGGRISDHRHFENGGWRRRLVAAMQALEGGPGPAEGYGVF